MTRRYDIDELIRLRESPLCVKPKDLPPVEEWMGQATEDRTKRSQLPVRGQRDSNGFTAALSSSSKPAALDFTRHGRQTSNGEFGSRALFSPGAREGEKASDSPSRSAFGPLSPRSEQPIGMGRFGLGDRDRAAARFTSLRSSKDEGESWANGKSNKRFDAEDGEKGPARRGEREQHSNGTRDHHRRFGSDAVNEGFRSKDWRSGDKNGGGGSGSTGRMGREWTNAQEQDPEWMAEEKPEPEPKKYTADDFEAWKKSMKAQAAGKTEAAGVSANVGQSASNPPPPVKKAIETPLVLEGGIDKFFGLWSAPEAPAAVENAPPGLMPKANGGAKAGKSSKFTSLFATEASPAPAQTAPAQPAAAATPAAVTAVASPPPPPTQTTASPPPAPPSQNLLSAFKSPAAEDQQGIERILNMLKNKPNANAAAVALLGGGSKQRTPPPPEATSTSATPPLVSPRPKSHGVQNFLNPQSPAPDANSQFLLNLMRSKDSDPSQPSHFSLQMRGPAPTSSQPSHFSPQYDRGPDGPSPQGFPPVFDKLNPSAHLNQQRRHGRGESRTFDEPHVPQHQQQQQHHHHHHQQQQQPHQQQQQQQQQQQHGPPPPGFPPGYPANLGGPNFPPGLGPTGNGQPGGYAQRGPVGMPPGFGQPGPFRNGVNYPPGFGIPQHMAGMNINEQNHGHGHGPGMPPGFGGPGMPGGPGGYGRPPPGFAERGGPPPHMGMPMDHFGGDGRRDEAGMYGPRD